MKAHILHHSSFEPLSDGHGGNRRTAQVVELIEKAGLSIQSVKPNQSIQPEMSARINRYWAGIQALRQYNLKLPCYYKAISRYGCQHLRYKDSIEQFQHGKVFVWEATRNYITPDIALQAKLKILALPQNLESLADAQGHSYLRSQLLSELSIEIQQLSKADAIFCISREEQWLLSLWGLEPRFLPYYPSESTLKDLKTIRDKRRFLEKKRFLIVGTAHNPPTRIGMIEQLEWLKEFRGEIEFEVSVVGYGTEALSDLFDQSHFNFLGAVDNKKLHYLMSRAKAVLVHQRAGVGALTRIPEMLIAGVPVIANSNACRSAFNYSGVYCYNTPAELLGLMETTLSIPEVLPPPKSAQDDFICQLKMLSQGFTEQIKC